MTISKESKILLPGAEKFQKESFVISKSEYTDNQIVCNVVIPSTLGQINLWMNNKGQVCGLDFMVEKDDN